MLTQDKLTAVERSAALAVYIGASVLLVTSKTQHGLLALPLALFLAVRPGGLSRKWVYPAACAIAFSGILAMKLTPEAYRVTPYFSMLFSEVPGKSPDV